MAHLENGKHCRQADLWQSLLNIKTIVSKLYWFPTYKEEISIIYCRLHLKYKIVSIYIIFSFEKDNIDFFYRTLFKLFDFKYLKRKDIGTNSKICFISIICIILWRYVLLKVSS